MKLKLIGAKERILHALKGGIVLRGQPFDVSEQIGKSLLSQNTLTQILWEEIKQKSKTKGAE
jgi:hypothetical protein